MSVKFLNRIGFVLFLNLLFTSIVFAAPIDLTGYRTDQLAKVSEELSPHFKRIQQSLKNPGQRSVGEDMASIRALSKYYLLEAAQTIWARLKLEFASPVTMRSPELRDLAQTALLDMITEEDNNLFMDIVRTEELILKVAADNEEHSVYLFQIADELKLLRNMIEQKPAHDAIPTFDQLRDSPRKNRTSALQALNHFEAILKKRIKGQDDAIKALTALEWESRFINNSEPSPRAVWFMGPPGTGKDTMAEAFTDALNGYEGAYKEHLYRMPIMRTQADLWQVLGSATGYVGSTQFPPFLEFLVNHSAGRYILAKSSNGTAINENPDWKGEPLPGFARPDQTVVFLNEFHNWSKEIKDVLVKQALEKGIFNINNPAGGLSSIEVPVYFMIASNDGIGLVTSRESNGQRHGKPLEYPAMHSKWEKVHHDKKRLKTEIMAGNGESRTPGGGNITGISEELLNRIPDRYLILLEPLAPESLQSIATTSLTKTAETLLRASVLNPGLKITWDPNVAEFIQSYDYNPEDNARPIASKVKSLVVEPLILFLMNDTLNAAEPLNLAIRIVRNENGTSSLEIRASEQSSGHDLGLFTQEIPTTAKDAHKPVVSDDVIDRMAKLSERIKSRVFGVDIIADRISERVLALANQTTASKDSARNASTLVLMGLSSTGKTELAKAVTEALTGDEKNALIIDFSQVQTLQEFKARVLGLRDGYGNPIPSDFMMHYDRLDGDVVVIFDELSNVRDPDLMKSLYDFFREPILSTFSDGKERNMSQVKVIVTGNSGIELYKNVPRFVSMEQQMMAWEQISESLESDNEVQRAVLEKSFPEPLINRWGMNNIFFVPPHTYKSLKQLATLKLALMVKALKPADGRRGWDIGFVNEAELESFIHKVIDNAFNLREQGASIDSFIKDDIQALLEAKLLLSKTPSGSKVLLKEKGDQFEILTAEKKIAGKIDFAKVVDPEKKEIPPSKVDQVLTAYHEIGHALTQKVLMNGISEPDMVSIVPGVAKINNEWIAYAGVARNKLNEQSRHTREWVIRQVAVLAAGETAERLATIDDVHSGGKSNDMMRATGMVEHAILTYGLSDSWGTEAVPQGVSLREYVNGFSEAKKKKFETEVDVMLNEGRQMAREILEKNWDNVMVPMSKELAMKGQLNHGEMAPFFEKVSKLDDQWKMSTNWFGRRLYDYLLGRSIHRDGVLRSKDLMPESVAVVADIVAAAKKKQFDEVGVPSDSFLFLDATLYAAAEPAKADCNDILKAP